MSIKQRLTKQLTHAVEQLGLSDISVQVETTADPTHGDYATNVALIAAKKLGKNPRELALEIAEKMKDAEGIEKVEVAGPGFINFWIKDATLVNDIATLELPQIGKDKKVIIEYSSPNIAKPFTVGHLRSTIIGDAIANLLAAVGYEVFRDNHVGDWGTQFGKQIAAIKLWGDEKAIASSERPIKELVSLYVKFHEEAEKDPSLEDLARAWFRKLEDSDPEAKRLWQQCIDWSWKEFDQIYQQLGVPSATHTEFENHGRGYGESFFENKMTSIITELKEHNLLHEGKEGAQIVDFPEETKLPPLMILKKDGATLYSTRDLATDKFRLFEHKEYGQDVLIINEVGAEQSLYFQQLYKLEELLGWVKPGQRVHVKHGLYRFKEGKMSTRKGNVIWLEDVLEEANNRAYGLSAGESKGKLGLERPVALHPRASTQNEIANKNSIRDFEEVEVDLKQVSSQVAIGALKWNDLKRDSKQDIAFDWEEILNMQGNSGPYLQYSYVRTKSVLEKAGKEAHEAYDFAQTTIALSSEERGLLRILARFPEVVQEAAERLTPNVLCTYLFELAQAFNLFYQKHQILKAEEDMKQFRLQLTKRTGEVLNKGLYLLGIQAPEKM